MNLRIKNFNIETIMNSGQIFRIYKNNFDNCYDLYERNKHVRIWTKDFLNYEFSCSKNEFNDFYQIYFDLNFDYNKIKKYVKDDDVYLKKCIEYGKGIKILNQNPFEMLISFIISQRKSIKAIRTSIEKLCTLCGSKEKDEYGSYYAFPTNKQIILKQNYLSNCGLGYRVPYILDACEKTLTKNIDLNNANISIDDLKQIKGVGDKVASCILLFAYHRLDICPKDVWINRVLDKYYNGNMPIEYNKYQGIYQQYLFNYAKDKR